MRPSEKDKSPYYIKNGQKTSLADEPDGKVDDAWHEKMKTLLPEYITNPAVRKHNQNPIPAKSHKELLSATVVAKLKGGTGSGYFGHAGRPGKVGGSAPSNQMPQSDPNRPKVVGSIATNPERFPYATSQEFLDKYSARVKPIGEEFENITTRIKQNNKLRKEILHKVPGGWEGWERRAEVDAETRALKARRRELNKELIAIDNEMRKELNSNGTDAGVVMFDSWYGGENLKSMGALGLSDELKAKAVELGDEVTSAMAEIQDSHIIRPELVKDGKVYITPVGGENGGAYDYRTDMITMSPRVLYHEVGMKSVRGYSKITILHEIGHKIEYNNPNIHQRLSDFFDKRTKGQPIKVTGGNAFWGLVSIADKFISPYTGRLYMRSDGKYTVWSDAKGRAISANFAPEEVLSTGIEFLVGRPAYFAMRDPEHFNLTVSILMGVPEK